MTTQQIADRLVALCRQWKNKEVYEELFADDATAWEPTGIPDRQTTGKENLIAKSDQFEEMVKEIHGNDVSDPLVYGDQFAVGMMVDMTRQDGQRVKMEELCVYEVKDGKIVSEHFIYPVPSQG